MESLVEVRDDPRAIADKLDADGVVQLDDAVAPEWVAAAQEAVERLIRTQGERDHFIRSPHGAEHRVEEAILTDPGVRKLLEDVVRTRFPEGVVNAELTDSALRVIAGPRGVGDAYWFHYDASVLTMMVPIFLPKADPGMSGELVGLFNNRPVRRFALVNVIDKVVGQSGMYRRRILRRIERGYRPPSVEMEVGNAYLFWGYRSLHGNMPVESGAVRATLLLHFGRPHVSSRLLKTAVRVRRMLRPAPGNYAGEDVSAVA